MNWLRVNAADRATLSTLDSLYIDAIMASTRHDGARAIDLYKQILEQTPEPEKPHVLVDLEALTTRIRSCRTPSPPTTEATGRNLNMLRRFAPGNPLRPTARDGAGARGFDKADTIYQALGNLEGRTEVVYQRGVLFNQLSRLSDATAQLERSADAGDSRGANCAADQSAPAAQHDRRRFRGNRHGGGVRAPGVDLAQKNGMENLGAQGLVDLGYAFSSAVISRRRRSICSRRLIGPSELRPATAKRARRVVAGQLARTAEPAG